MDQIHGFSCAHIAPSPPTETDYTVFNSQLRIFITAKA